MLPPFLFLHKNSPEELHRLQSQTVTSLLILNIYVLFSFSFLPEDPEVLEWDEKSWRDTDWVKNAECKKILGWDHSDNSAEFIYLENPELQLYR